MVTRFLFKDRDGRTPLPQEFKKDLTPTYAHLQLGRELDEAEEENMLDGLVWLEDHNNQDPKEALFWFRLHKKLFERVWIWAGKIRTHELMNDDFNKPGYIHENIKKLEGDLAFWLSPEAKMTPQEALARFHEGLLTIHPFANGNGRTTRILTEAICSYEKIPLPTWGASMRDDAKIHRNSYIAAIDKARHQKNLRELIEFMFG